MGGGELLRKHYYIYFHFKPSISEKLECVSTTSLECRREGSLFPGAALPFVLREIVINAHNL